MNFGMANLWLHLLERSQFTELQIGKNKIESQTDNNYNNNKECPIIKTKWLLHYEGNGDIGRCFISGAKIKNKQLSEREPFKFMFDMTEKRKEIE